MPDLRRRVARQTNTSGSRPTSLPGKAASDLIARWNASGEIGSPDIPDINEAVGKLIANAEAPTLAGESVKKIRDAVERRFLGFCEAKGSSRPAGNQRRLRPRSHREP